MAGGNTIGGGDETFISFSFAIVSVIMFILYIPWLIRHLRDAVNYLLLPTKKQAAQTNPFLDMWHSITYIPRVILLLVADPVMLKTGARVCWVEKVFFFRCVMPKFLKFAIRPKIFVLWLWVILFSSAMYITLTFDPHAILGVPPSATVNEVKKAYRALSMRYHPDRNKTQEARNIYAQVLRAYKALTDRKAFEEEEASSANDFSVGVALPSFLTSRKHDGLVLFGLLGILIGLPIIVWYNFSGTQKLAHLLWRVNFDKERVEHFLGHLGIPEDPKYVERRDSRRAIYKVLTNLGILPENTRESFLAKFPPFPEFITRCVEVDKNMTYMQSIFDNDAIQTLHEYMLKNGVQLLDEFVAAHAEIDSVSSPEQQLVSFGEYKAIRYLFSQHIVQVDEALEDLLNIFNGSLPGARKLLNLHDELFDLLRLVFESEGKPMRQHIQKLMAMPQRVTDIVDSLEPEIETVYKRAYKNSLEQQLSSRYERRRLKTALRNM